VESLAGVGESFDSAVLDALDMFHRGSFHVLLAALVDRHLASDQVEWERWSIRTHAWHICLGPLLLHSTEIRVPPYAELLDQLKESFLAQAGPRVHWIRTFRGAAGSTAFGSEALLDNDEWPAGKAIVDSWRWPVTERYQTVRHFLVALPVS
jgi:hypothetical protein